MKFTKLTVLLLAMNFAWMGAVGYLIKKLHDSQTTVGDAENVPPDETVKVAESKPALTAPTTSFHWRQLESEDYRTYIQRLRSIGCPEQTIRDLIIADIDKTLAPRMQSIIPRRKDLKFWQPEDEELWNNYDQREWFKQERSIDQEKREAVRELVGVDLVEERLKQQGKEDYYSRRLSFLPEEKRGQVRTVLETYGSQEQAIQEKVWEDGEPLTVEDKAQLHRLQEEKQTQIAALLSPAEREQFELWLSPTANAARNAVYGMNATEEEFMTIYKLRKTFDETWNQEGLDLDNPALRAQREQAAKQLDEQIKVQLGEERFADYQRAQDPDYRQLNATVARFKLPGNTANEVYEMKRVLLEQQDKVRADSNLTPEQKENALKAMADEAEKIVKVTLGEKAFSFFQRRGSGQWMRK